MFQVNEEGVVSGTHVRKMTDKGYKIINIWSNGKLVSIGIPHLVLEYIRRSFYPDPDTLPDVKPIALN